MNANVILPETDEGLAQAAATGSPEALAELYRRHSDLVYRVAYRLVSEPAEAEDVLQDVFIGLPEALARFDPSRPLEPWLKRVAARAAISRARSSIRREQRAVAATDVHWVHARSPLAPLDRIILRHALDQLPVSLRSVLLLKEVEGYSHEEIGEMLGISSGNAATRLHRAWSKLRQTLDG